MSRITDKTDTGFWNTRFINGNAELDTTDKSFFYVHMDNRPAAIRIPRPFFMGSTNRASGSGWNDLGPNTKNAANTGVAANWFTAPIQAFHPGGFLGSWQCIIRRSTDGTTVFQGYGDGSGSGNNGQNEDWSGGYTMKAKIYSTTRNGFGVIESTAGIDETAFAFG